MRSLGPSVTAMCNQASGIDAVSLGVLGPLVRLRESAILLDGGDRYSEQSEMIVSPSNCWAIALKVLWGLNVA
jgi:hypothetical protein